MLQLFDLRYTSYLSEYKTEVQLFNECNLRKTAFYKKREAALVTLEQCGLNKVRSYSWLNYTYCKK